MKKLITPFGPIDIRIDEQPVPYTAQEGKRIAGLCPDVLGRFQITVPFSPDGRKHRIACEFPADDLCERTPESGEGLECQSFFNDRGFKMSLGLSCEAGLICGDRLSDVYDYDAEYLENGMAYLILPETKTERFVFGISWIDNVSPVSPLDSRHDRAVQTWFGADPALHL